MRLSVRRNLPENHCGKVLKAANCSYLHTKIISAFTLPFPLIPGPRTESQTMAQRTTSLSGSSRLSLSVDKTPAATQISVAGRHPLRQEWVTSASPTEHPTLMRRN